MCRSSKETLTKLQLMMMIWRCLLLWIYYSSLNSPPAPQLPPRATPELKLCRWRGSSVEQVCDIYTHTDTHRHTQIHTHTHVLPVCMSALMKKPAIIAHLSTFANEVTTHHSPLTALFTVGVIHDQLFLPPPSIIHAFTPPLKVPIPWCNQADNNPRGSCPPLACNIVVPVGCHRTRL